MIRQRQQRQVQYDAQEQQHQHQHQPQQQHAQSQVRYQDLHQNNPFNRTRSMNSPGVNSNAGVYPIQPKYAIQTTSS